ncbi:agmatine deiminase [Marinomonas epiphytica]
MKKALISTPQQDNFYMPGEHTPQEQVWMAWPFREDNWRDQAIPAQQEFIAVANAIADSTPVTFIADPAYLRQARRDIPDSIRVIEMAYNDSWMRDIGASYLINTQGERRAVSWQFNAWGGELDGLYDNWQDDDLVAAQMANQTEDLYYQAPFILEGGSIHLDGEGTVYTTEECLLHPSRNPHLSKQQIEAFLCQYLNASKVIWLTKGLYNDETNGHVDNIMHVIRPGVVALTWCEDNTDPQYEISQHAYHILSQTQDAKGRDLEIIKLPLPGPLYVTAEEARSVQSNGLMARQAGERLAASYANFLISNNRVIVPLLDDQTDQQALDILQNAFPEHTVVGVATRNILLGGGNIHCITQQVPKKCR